MIKQFHLTQTGIISPGHSGPESKGTAEYSTIPRFQNYYMYKKADNMIPQSWVIECLKTFKISEQVIKFITRTLQNWKVELAAEIKI